MQKCHLRKLIQPFYLISSFFLFSIFTSNCSTAPKKSESALIHSNLENLRKKIVWLISDPNLFNAQVGIYIESIDRGEAIFAQNEHKLFISASNMKMFTTAATLLNFGPDFKYKTDVFSSQPIKNGKIEGDLIIRGSGDPTIAPRFSNGDHEYFFRAWADSLSARGLKYISGDIIGDASYFQTEPLGFGWQWDDEPFWYSAQISALSYNDNCIDVTVVASDQIGQPPEVILFPQTDYFSIDNRAITTAPDSVRTLFITRPRLQNRLLIRNEIPINKPRYNESISVEDPAKYFVYVLRDVLRQKGITIKGDVKSVKEADKINYDQKNLLFTHYSPPLSDIIRAVNKRSQNLYAEQLLLTLAAEFGKTASATEGTKVVTNTLAGMGIPESEFLMHDGSGLSRVNLISPNSVGLLLRYMAVNKYFSYFFNSLPISGIDGTLRKRMVSTTAEGKIRAKTGYVGHVRNLSGYAETEDGERLIFSILVNNYLHPTAAINLLQDKICILLANFKR